MSDLASKKCIPCEGNIPPFNTEEIHKYLKQVDGWGSYRGQNRWISFNKKF